MTSRFFMPLTGDYSADQASGQSAMVGLPWARADPAFLQDGIRGYLRPVFLRDFIVFVFLEDFLVEAAFLTRRAFAGVFELFLPVFFRAFAASATVFVAFFSDLGVRLATAFFTLVAPARLMRSYYGRDD
jgi:hypothetical protein